MYAAALCGEWPRGARTRNSDDLPLCNGGDSLGSPFVSLPATYPMTTKVDRSTRVLLHSTGHAAGVGASRQEECRKECHTGGSLNRRECCVPTVFERVGRHFPFVR
jgi:hypothetical protein